LQYLQTVYYHSEGNTFLHVHTPYQSSSLFEGPETHDVGEKIAEHFKVFVNQLKDKRLKGTL